MNLASFLTPALPYIIGYNITPEKVPVASGFDFPVGDKNAKGWNGVNDKGWYIASGFLRPFFHPGEDWNGLGGGNTDFGEPVYSISEGRVVYAKDSFRWGNIAVIQHRLPDGEIIFSMYAHLKDLYIKAGEEVKRRQRIGSVGRGYKDTTYKSAHLHFEIRRYNMSRYPAIFWPRLLTSLVHFNRPFSETPAKEWIISHYYNPSKFIRNHRDMNKRRIMVKRDGRKSGIRHTTFSDDD